jgi:hypothetical protein
LDPKAPKRNGLDRELIWWGLGGLGLTLVLEGVVTTLVFRLYYRGVLTKSDVTIVAITGIAVATVLGSTVMLIGLWRVIRKSKSRRDAPDRR